MSLVDTLIASAQKRPPDLQIGGSENPYLNRWYVIPRNRLFNIYVHQFIRDDDDGAEHDHPWWSLSFMARGALFEQMNGAMTYIWPRTWRWRSARLHHRLEIPSVCDPGSVWTIFITGPRLREWGFHCPNGWVHWKDFTAGVNGEVVGRGCGEAP